MQQLNEDVTSFVLTVEIKPLIQAERHTGNTGRHTAECGS